VESEEKSPEVNNLVSGLGPGSTCFAGSHRRSLGSGMQLLRGRETLGERLPARSTHRARPIRNTVPETVENDRLRSLFYIFRKRRTGGISANLKRCNMQNRHERDAHTPSSDTTCHRAPPRLVAYLARKIVQNEIRLKGWMQTGHAEDRDEWSRQVLFNDVKDAEKFLAPSEKEILTRSREGGAPARMARPSRQ
jgi:hypothetical protein